MAEEALKNSFLQQSLLVAEQVSRNDLSGLMFNLGAEYDRTLQTVLAAFKNEYGTQTTLSQWRSEAGDAIMKLGYEDFKNVYQNYQTIDLKQWSIQRLVDEQVALQSIHEKYVSKLAPPLRLIMQGKAKIENILNVQDRIDKGCGDMGYEAKCGVSK